MVCLPKETTLLDQSDLLPWENMLPDKYGLPTLRKHASGLRWLTYIKITCFSTKVVGLPIVMHLHKESMFWGKCAGQEGLQLTLREER